MHPGWTENQLLHIGDEIYIPKAYMDTSTWNPPAPTPQPTPTESTWLGDGFVTGDSNLINCVYIGGQVICPGMDNCPPGVIGAGDGHETVTNFLTHQVATYHYQYAIYNYGVGASLGEIKFEKHAGFVEGFSEKLGFEQYSGLSVCHSTSVTGQWKVLGVDSVLWWEEGGAADIETALCGPGPIGPFKGCQRLAHGRDSRRLR
jgi:hypothetical protein